MSEVYKQFDKATSQFTAQALLLNGEPVGRIIVKFGNAATAYVQLWGAPMASARATGYGYDKASAAIMSAIKRMCADEYLPHDDDKTACEAHAKLTACAIMWDGGTRYTNAIETAGLTVTNVI